MPPGRKSKLTPTLQQEIVDNLTLGCTVRDCCELAGLAEGTFYRWCEQKSEFKEAITQAQAKARRAAVMAIRINLAETKSKTAETVIFEETRLRWVAIKNEAGQVIGKEQQPYTYRKTTVTNREAQTPPDWRAGVEYLKRRDRDHWSDKTTVQVDDWRSQAIEDIKAGKISFEALRDAFDHETATELFTAAGASIPPATGAGLIQ